MKKKKIKFYKFIGVLENNGKKKIGISIFLVFSSRWKKLKKIMKKKEDEKRKKKRYRN